MSSSDRTTPQALVDERDALSVYFEALLREEPLELEVPVWWSRPR